MITTPRALISTVLLLLTAALVPIDNPSHAALLAVFVARAMQVSLFEVPVAMRTAQGGEPRAELGRRLEAGALSSSRYAGAAAVLVDRCLYAGDLPHDRAVRFDRCEYLGRDRVAEGLRNAPGLTLGRA